MSDIDFLFKFSPNTYKDVIQRTAVLYPLTRPVTGPQAVAAQTQKVLNMWRARVGTLTAAGWEPRRGSQSARAITYTRNCCPAFTFTEPRTRPCRAVTICPFCYARWVRTVWERIDAAFPPPTPVAANPLEAEHNRALRHIQLDATPEEPAQHYAAVFPYHLVECQLTSYRDVLPPAGTSEVTLAENLAGLLRNLSNSKNKFVKYIAPAGAFVYITVEPHDAGRQWKIQRRQIFKVKPEQIMPPDVITTPKLKLTRHERPTRRVIFEAVEKACRYPVALMRGDVERTVLLLDTRRQLRFKGSSCYGAFRRRQHV